MAEIEKLRRKVQMDATLGSALAIIGLTLGTFNISPLETSFGKITFALQVIFMSLFWIAGLGFLITALENRYKIHKSNLKPIKA